jgi:hypothetical protein
LHGVMVSHFDSRFAYSRRLQDDDSVIYSAIDESGKARQRTG